MENDRAVEHIADVSRAICVADGEISELAYQLLMSVTTSNIDIEDAIIEICRHYDIKGEKC